MDEKVKQALEMMNQGMQIFGEAMNLLASEEVAEPEQEAAPAKGKSLLSR